LKRVYYYFLRRAEYLVTLRWTYNNSGLKNVKESIPLMPNIFVDIINQVNVIRML